MNTKDSNCPFPTRVLGKEEYPSLLRSSRCAPDCLYVKGTLPMEKAAFIAMVGTRRPSPGAEERCRRLVKNLRGTNAVVVSGLAQGIDCLCHQAALDFGIPTVAVLAQGLEAPIGGSRGRIAQRILDSGGALVTEYPGDSPSYKSCFPARNRIIAGLSQATIVVESRDTGGALITADFFLEEGRILGCVPGDWDRDTAQGPNQLLREGKARPVWDPRDFADFCGAVRESDLTLAAFSRTEACLSPEAQSVFLQNAGFTRTAEELRSSGPFALPALLAILTELEIAGLVHSKEGHAFHFSAPE